ncbi:unnamed protein product [Amoebophrya sp. A120]|nr:unnamed protein product [Amoebophrya sp. A120]|eukprot:GSA120T00013710001.1
MKACKNMVNRLGTTTSKVVLRAGVGVVVILFHLLAPGEDHLLFTPVSALNPYCPTCAPYNLVWIVDYDGTGKKTNGTAWVDTRLDADNAPGLGDPDIDPEEATRLLSDECVKSGCHAVMRWLHPGGVSYHAREHMWWKTEDPNWGGPKERLYPIYSTDETWLNDFAPPGWNTGLEDKWDKTIAPAIKEQATSASSTTSSNKKTILSLRCKARPCLLRHRGKGWREYSETGLCGEEGEKKQGFLAKHADWGGDCRANACCSVKNIDTNWWNRLYKNAYECEESNGSNTEGSNRHQLRRVSETEYVSSDKITQIATKTSTLTREADVELSSPRRAPPTNSGRSDNREEPTEENDGDALQGGSADGSSSDLKQDSTNPAQYRDGDLESAETSRDLESCSCEEEEVAVADVGTVPAFLETQTSSKLPQISSSSAGTSVGGQDHEDHVMEDELDHVVVPASTRREHGADASSTPGRPAGNEKILEGSNKRASSRKNSSCPPCRGSFAEINGTPRPRGEIPEQLQSELPKSVVDFTQLHEVDVDQERRADGDDGAGVASKMNDPDETDSSLFLDVEDDQQEQELHQHFSKGTTTSAALPVVDDPNNHDNASEAGQEAGAAASTVMV